MFALHGAEISLMMGAVLIEFNVSNVVEYLQRTYSSFLSSSKNSFSAIKYVF